MVDVTLRQVKGSALTHAELDANFTNLKTASEAPVLNQVASEAAPPAGTVKLFAKADGRVYKKLPNGDESEIGAGGGNNLSVLTRGSTSQSVGPAYTLPVLTRTGTNILGYLL